MSKTYDASEIHLFVGGVPISAGRDAGAFVRITSPGGGLYTVTRGADKEVVHNRTNIADRKADIILMKSSLSNSFLSTIVTSDRIALGGLEYPFIMRHSGQQMVLVATSAKIIEDPTVAGVDYGAEVGTFTWGLSLTGIRQFWGGMTETPLAPV